MSVFPVKISSVSGGVVQFGPSVFISPKGASKTFTGSGSDNLAVQIYIVNGVSSTNTLDSDGVDQPIFQNN
jgi:hypothetical protein